MKSPSNHLSTESYAVLQAEQAIQLITLLIDERYPKISSGTKSKLITQCLVELQQEKLSQICLN